ncbi:hypothetical protein [Actinomyces culturomici]|uniref:hypothetical protein n=1 Tax=Actinomyces culturomici TaxID=1926276 RepID=UPI000E20AF5B|nr:hypothetical protein [Actinomyces culturomici]
MTATGRAARARLRSCGSTLLVVGLVALGGCSTGPVDAAESSAMSASIGPNSELPPARAASSGCARMDGILADAFVRSDAGRAFVEAQAQVAPENDAAASEARAVAVRDSWIAFLAAFSAASSADLAVAATEDAKGRAALEALRDYAEKAPPMLCGEVPQFADEAQAMQDLAAGRQPALNPEYERLASELASDVDILSECMPAWPLVF